MSLSHREKGTDRPYPMQSIDDYCKSKYRHETTVSGYVHSLERSLQSQCAQSITPKEVLELVSSHCPFISPHQEHLFNFNLAAIRRKQVPLKPGKLKDNMQAIVPLECQLTLYARSDICCCVQFKKEYIEIPIGPFGFDRRWRKQITGTCYSSDLQIFEKWTATISKINSLPNKINGSITKGMQYIENGFTIKLNDITLDILDLFQSELKGDDGMCMITANWAGKKVNSDWGDERVYGMNWPVDTVGKMSPSKWIMNSFGLETLLRNDYVFDNNQVVVGQYDIKYDFEAYYGESLEVEVETEDEDGLKLTWTENRDENFKILVSHGYGL